MLVGAAEPLLFIWADASFKASDKPRPEGRRFSTTFCVGNSWHLSLAWTTAVPTSKKYAISLPCVVNSPFPTSLFTTIRYRGRINGVVVYRTILPSAAGIHSRNKSHMV